jgi:hypothetical protein
MFSPNAFPPPHAADPADDPAAVAGDGVVGLRGLAGTAAAGWVQRPARRIGAKSDRAIASHPMFRYKLRTLLILMAVIASFIGLYVQVWRFNHAVPALFTTAVTATSFLAIQRRHQKNEMLGAALGGAVGGILSIALHRIACEVLLPDVYEYEGLPVFEFTLLFSPVGAVCGMLVGLLVWMFAFLSRIDAEMRAAGGHSGSA